jgi:hypothetical protein
MAAVCVKEGAALVIGGDMATVVLEIKKQPCRNIVLFGSGIPLFAGETAKQKRRCWLRNNVATVGWHFIIPLINPDNRK